MKKSIWIFLLAVLLPSVVLGWLALRSVEEQKIILERRTAALYQSEADNVAAAARAVIDEQRRTFSDAVRKLIGADAPEKAAGSFTKALGAAWPRQSIGFAIGADGRLLAPSVRSAAESPELKKFLLENSAFLGGNLAATVYQVPVDELNRPEQMRKMKGGYPPEAQALKSKAALANAEVIQPAKPSAAQAFEPAPDAAKTQMRNVMPQQALADSERAQISTLWSATTGFRILCEGKNEGMITRFVQDRLEMIFWLRPVQAPEMIFGCLIDAESLRDLWPATMPENGSRDIVLALLDEKARPVVMHPPNQSGRDWKRPFVASEIGEALPHWEAALYLMRPEQLQESARGVRRTLTFLIVAMLGAIACGGWLVVRDARRQLELAQQKTDFVSNVSHELKTPLTSIRMFAELMQNGRADAAEKAPQYLRIIMFEAERLTRLINNVLDFAKLERRQKRFDRKPLDLHAVIARTWEAHELHLRESGFATHWQADPPPYPVTGDEDALAQILVNLLSNAEKYAGAQREVELRSSIEGDWVCVSVADRGIGVPTGEERKIFEAFHRGHDSLSSGIQGSGLGLTLAQRLAHEHGGEIAYAAREGGGSVFTLRLPSRVAPGAR